MLDAWTDRVRALPDALAPLRERNRPGYLRFVERIGLRTFERADSFSPFYHEIVAVTPDETADEVTVAEVRWPGAPRGSRRGDHVHSVLHLPAAAAPDDHPSHGWGSNSQWRTGFHRWYDDAAGLQLNWDGERYLGDGHLLPSPPDPNDVLSLAQRRHLLLHRCFVTAPLRPDDADLYPFQDRLSLRTSAWPLPPDAALSDPG